MNETMYLWRIRVEGVGMYPRCRSAKRKTVSAISTEKGIQERAENLRKYGGYKILWIKNLGEYK